MKIKIIIELGNKKIELTPEEAQELKRELDMILVAKEWYPYVPIEPSYPVYTWYEPINTYTGVYIDMETVVT